MSQPPLPLGLHVHLVGTGPTLRFVLWAERPAEADAARPRASASDAPTPHPFALPHRERPRWMPDDFPAVTCLVTLPALADRRPIPLPGLAPAWEPPKSPAVAAGVFRVPAWVVPASHALDPLRQLLLAWAHRYGPGCLSPHAPRVIDLLAALRDRITRGPLLPTLAPPPRAWADGACARDLSAEPRAALAWAPPLSLAALEDLAAQLRAERFLAAAPEHAWDADEGALTTWADDAHPRRLGRFVIEVADAAARRAGAAPTDRAGLRDAVARGEADATHRARGSCLFPRHPVFADATAPDAHLHARVQTGDESAAVALGLAAGDAFLPLSALAGRGAHSLVEHEGRAWSFPAEVITRDWERAVAAGVTALVSPELLGGALSAAEARKLLARPPMSDTAAQRCAWLAALGFDEAEAGDLAAFTAGSGRVEAVAPQGDRFALGEARRDPATDDPAAQVTVWCALSTEQRGRYAAAAKAVVAALRGQAAGGRRAAVLGAVSRLSRECDHPALEGRDRPEALFGRSPKFDRAVSLVGALVDAGRKVLVVTRFVEMADALQRGLRDRAGVEADVDHGGLAEAARAAIVASFASPKGPPALVAVRAAAPAELHGATAVVLVDHGWSSARVPAATKLFVLATRGTLEERLLASPHSQRLAELEDDVLAALIAPGAPEDA